MKPEKQQLAILKLRGWHQVAQYNKPEEIWKNTKTLECVGESKLPDYLNDLNEILEVVKGLTDAEYANYSLNLARVVRGFTRPRMHDATAAQRAEAILKALNLWETELENHETEKYCFVVLAFRYGGYENVFPIGSFTSEDKAKSAAKDHRNYRGGKYSHRIYKFRQDKWDDDIGTAVNFTPCIEETRETTKQ
jgi:hypothetical protein